MRHSGFVFFQPTARAGAGGLPEPRLLAFKEVFCSMLIDAWNRIASHRGDIGSITHAFP
jgi:hypothetical protein